jgi:uncharacterized protein YmfQ (DUF2313 family)
VPLDALTPLDYLYQFQRLLPRGRVWHRGWGTLQAQDLLTLMPTWSRLDARAAQEIVDAFPCSTVELLPEWEASLGLPDPCTGPLPTLQQRTAAVCAKFAARGGQSMEYFIHLAAALGFQIEIQTFKPFYAGQGQAGTPLYSEAWAYAWRVIVQSEATITWFRAGMSAAGEPLAFYGGNLVECALAALAPANTVLIWGLRINSSVWDDGSTIWDAGDSIWDEEAVSPP